MRVRTLLATTVAGLLLAGMSGLPASADPGVVPANRAGQLATWGPAAASAQTTIPESLAGKVVTGISLSDNATGVVTDDGKVTIWGKNDPLERYAPEDLSDVKALSLASQNGLALKQDGTVVAWGTAPDIASVPAGLHAKAIAMNGGGTNGVAYAVTTEGTLTSWGAAFNEVSNPAPPTGLTNLVDVSATSTQGMVLDSAGNVTVWAAPSVLPSMTPPADIQGHVVKIATGATVNGAILDDGSIRVWGVQAPAVPASFAGKTFVKLDIHKNGIAVTNDGQVYAWGPTTGTVNPFINTVPATVSSEYIAAVAVSTNHAAVIATDFRAVTAPTISGSAVVGQTLTATPAELSLEPDEPAVGQWLADGDEIDGQTGTTLTLDTGLLGKKISYRTSATRGDDDIESVSDETAAVAPVTVASTTTLTVTPSNGSYGTARTATATVTKAGGGAATGNVTFTMHGTDVTRVLSGGSATWALPATLAVGSHDVTATYAGAAGIEPSSAAPVTVTVGKVTSTTTLTVSPATGGYGTARTATATVSIPDNTPTGSVEFAVGGVKETALLNAGKATWVLPASLAVGTQAVTATYTGTSTTDASTATPVTVTVSKATSKLTAAKPKVAGKNKKVAKKTTLTLKVTTAAGISPAGKVVLTLKGKTNKKVPATVNAKGVATVVVKNLKRGAYTGTWTYAGSTSVTGGSAKIKKFKV